jgi:hypothetical protein
LGEPVEALPPPAEAGVVQLGNEFGGRIVKGGEEDGESVEGSTSSSRPSTRGRRDSTKQVVVEEVMPEKEPEPDGTHCPPLVSFSFRMSWADGGSEEERHKAFQALRKKHYEMKDAIKLGHQLEEEEEEDDDEPRRQGNGPEKLDQDLVNGHTTNA